MAMRVLWDNFETIGEVQKTDSTKVVISACCKDGVRNVTLREFYLRKRDNAWLPGKGGLTLSLDRPINKGTKVLHVLKDIVDMLEVAAERARTMPIEDEANKQYYDPDARKNEGATK